MKKYFLLTAYILVSLFLTVRVLWFYNDYQSDIITVSFPVLWLFFYAAKQTLRTYLSVLAAGALFTGFVYSSLYRGREKWLCLSVSAMAGIVLLLAMRFDHPLLYLSYPFLPCLAGIALGCLTRKSTYHTG